MSLSASDVTIIAVNWNGRVHLETLLPSILDQGAGEIIVVDNGSADDSVRFLEENYPSVRILKNPVNMGFSQPNNLAAKAAKGKILAFINNDMKAGSEWVSNGIRKLETYDCVSSRILSWDGKSIDFNGSSLQYLGYALQKNTGDLLTSITDKGGEILFPCGGAMFIRTELFLESGGFDENFFAIYEDVDLGWRLWVTGRRIALDGDSIVYHKGHATFQTQDNSRMRYLMHRNALLTILKNYADDTVKKVFPMAMMMAVRRAVRCSGVRKESFYLWEEARRGLDSGDEPTRISNLDALNHLVAVDDAIKMLPDILEKRRIIQAKRKTGDDQILSLFEDPLRIIVEDADYTETEARLLEALGLDSLFDLKAYKEKTESFLSQVDQAKENSRRELLALQWLGGYALLHPPDRILKPRSRLRKFLGTARTNGLGAAISLAWKSIKSRIPGGD
jgi:GT2 family glycosyltransferase